MIQQTKELITVVVVDDHHLIRQGVRNLLVPRDDMELVGEGATGDDVLALMEQHTPDVLLIDLSMPQSGAGGSTEKQFKALPTIARLSKSYPDTAIIVLTQHFVPVIIRGAIDLGVKGYLLKSDDLSLNLPSAVATVSKGGVYFSETIGEELFGKSKADRAVDLTARQIEILTTIARLPDDSYASQAASLGITESTLKNHLTKAFKALGVKNITAAIIRCMQLGIIPLKGT
ncbi:MAG: response regulator transcription factor [Anaerolineales bacterium]|nr:response regulator transcription factor [Anaerolineales bacterium]